MAFTSLALGSLIAIAVYTDLRYRRIPNAVLVPFMLLGVILQAAGHGWSGIWASLTGFGLGFVLLLPAYLAGGIGGGDVKLLATIGALSGSAFTWRVFLAGAISGGLLALVQLGFEGRLLLVLKDLGFWLWSFITPGVQPAALTKLDSERQWGKLPYAVPLSLGVIICWLWW